MSEAWGRRLKLLAYLMRKGYAQTAEVARYLEVDRRKAREDLVALDEHGVPLTVIPEEDTRDPERTWNLDRSWRMTGLEVKLLERLALLLGKEVLEPLLGASDLGNAMVQLERELASFADGVETSDSELLRRFHLVQEPSKGYADKGTIVSDLVAAIAYPYRITVEYRSPRAEQSRTHAKVRPLTLAIYRRGLYVFVMFDSDRVIALSVDRIIALTPHIELDFDYPIKSKWDPNKYLAKRFGLHPGAGIERVRLRFPAGSKAYVLERQWMVDQVIEERADGGVDVVFEADGLELAHRVLEWGGYCEVVEPPSLRAKVLELAEQIAARHR